MPERRSPSQRPDEEGPLKPAPPPRNPQMPPVVEPGGQAPTEPAGPPPPDEPMPTQREAAPPLQEEDALYEEPPQDLPRRAPAPRPQRRVLSVPDQVARQYTEEMIRGGTIPHVSRGDIPRGLRGTIFGQMWKSGVVRISLYYYGEEVPKAGTPSLELFKDMVESQVVIVNITYAMLRGDACVCRIGVVRRDKRTSEKIGNVLEMKIEDAVRRVIKSVRRKPFVQRDEIFTDSDDPEVCRVLCHRKDKARHQMRFRVGQGTLEKALAIAVCQFRRKPRLKNPVKNPHQFSEGDVEGDLSSAARASMMDLVGRVPQPGEVVVRAPTEEEIAGFTGQGEGGEYTSDEFGEGSQGFDTAPGGEGAGGGQPQPWGDDWEQGT